MVGCYLQLTFLQIVSGRHKQVTYVLHRLIGAAVESASQWRRLNMSTQNAVKGMELFGVLYFKLIQHKIVYFWSEEGLIV